MKSEEFIKNFHNDLLLEKLISGMESNIKEYNLRLKEIDEIGISPIYGPKDEVMYAIFDSPQMFVVSEVNHKTKEYKMLSKSPSNRVTIHVEWELVDKIK